MKESIAAIKWVANLVMVACILGAVWLGYKFATEPGYLAELTLGVEQESPFAPRSPVMDGPPSDPVVTSRLPQASGMPQAGGASASERRLSNDSGSGATTDAGSYAPRTSATGGLRTVTRKTKQAPEAYQPPVAQRKVVRVGD
ncbi:hypothetical protein [Vannielia litorea]|uniref:hypothetical protein n=1 Tax=Vannielia litorea TaxID=1217970 RepID=UPI001C97E9A9|nr:hypothetical protein [Vannielia litorea]MBY6049059.1 hypothetical protein [Vannielia litorea]MBY6076473.1 hypothetical protein [Vannielia litorea]